MKAVAAILIILNLGLAYWLWSGKAVNPQANVAASSSGVAGSCYSVNVYDEEVLDSLRTAIRKLQGSLVTEEFSQWVDGDKWWVVSAENPEQSLDGYRAMVNGAFEIADGPKAGRYSLGIFSSESNANALRRELGEENLNSELLLYQLRKPAWRAVIRVEQAEGLINRYQLEFIEKKSC
ncbi:hypothetical protein [Umboniibacter marinipuniceus]|uniref:Sporulation related protein n=1 Tax=Umboniibacter marinipuniceus TaxID=569599 RepID=A0A3M0A1H3_9GAMM|nr:hypothetical protein [Umboniibacter marinipuniceus]RMA78466.1 hypothetical protein DFR27_2405 [Umboniibacter marinipuniceus]